MGRKNVIRGVAMLEAATATTNQTSIVVNVINLDKASIFVDWTDATGTMTVEAQNGDNEPWFVLDFGSPIALTGTGSHVLIFNELPHNAIRLQYTASSGAGEIDAVIAAKQVGG